jgi:hypothetical protein
MPTEAKPPLHLQLDPQAQKGCQFEVPYRERFEPAALETLAQSFVDLKILDAKPDMSKLYIEK